MSALSVDGVPVGWVPPTMGGGLCVFGCIVNVIVCDVALSGIVPVASVAVHLMLTCPTCVALCVYVWLVWLFMAVSFRYH